MRPYNWTVATPGGPPNPANWGLGYQLVDFLALSAANHISSVFNLPAIGISRMKISGYSNGGQLACAAAYTTSLFSGAYCGSPAFWMNNGQVASIISSTAPAVNTKVFIDVSDKEQTVLVNFVHTTYQAYLARDEFTLGGNLMYAFYRDQPDSHQWNSWSKRTGAALSFLYNDPFELGTTTINCVNHKVLHYPPPFRPFGLTASFTIPVNKPDQLGGTGAAYRT